MLFRDEQNGFQRAHDTKMQLCRHVETVTQGYNQNWAIVAIYWDFKHPLIRCGIHEKSLCLCRKLSVLFPMLAASSRISFNCTGF